ncbi:MAG: PEP-CTERM sorting domain-containing protein [Burkholderiales bacterium]|nr:PEP-CTERM sorting domain-containing protein [Burkholderiales bacterium]MDE1926096.1 PEP-CTERM sorting domain-containing protein [Burkholderiales bacterium]MDE2158734.1 PEP-CTERM sorting domain-containing protein [Burkholderiales bacterium]MDE2504753.1 PEP-CTERM sorting domain-containing protein [Burkholderiales bacterium]
MGTSVPEPCSYAMMGLGLFAVAAAARRRRA